MLLECKTVILLMLGLMNGSLVGCAGISRNSCAEGKSLEQRQAPPPIVVTDRDGMQIPSVSGAVSGGKVSCRDAKVKVEVQLCAAVIPDKYKEDEVSMDAFEITFRELELNDESPGEIVAWESSWAGTSGGGLWLLRRSENGYEKLFETDSSWPPVIALNTRSGDWRDIGFFVRGGGVEPHFSQVRFDGKSYRAERFPSGEEPEGEILIPDSSRQTVFGPLPDQ